MSESEAGPQANHCKRSPIFALPPELIVQIFLHVSTTFGYNPQWVDLMRVCVLWRDIGLATPELWRWIRLSRNLARMSQHLTYSRNTTIDLEVCSTLNDTRPEDLEPAMRLVIPHATRIRSVSTAVEFEWLTLLVPLFHNEMPELRTISIATLDDEDGRDDRDKSELALGISGHLQPQVRNFVANRIEVPFGGPFWYTMRVMDIRIHADHPVALDPTDILKIIQTAPCLEVIKLAWIFNNSHPPLQALSPMPPTTLDALHTLHVSGPAIYLPTLLEGIRAPSLACLHIDADVSPGLPRAVALSVAGLLPPTVHPFLASLTTLRVRETFCGFYIADAPAPESRTFMLNVRLGRPGKLHRALCALALALRGRAPHLARLTIEDHWDGAPASSWAEVFTAFSDLSTLEFDCHAGEVVCAALEALVKLANDGSGSGSGSGSDSAASGSGSDKGRTYRGSSVGVQELVVRAEVDNSLEAHDVLAGVRAFAAARLRCGKPLEGVALCMAVWVPTGVLFAPHRSVLRELEGMCLGELVIEDVYREAAAWLQEEPSPAAPTEEEITDGDEGEEDVKELWYDVLDELLAELA